MRSLLLASALTLGIPLVASANQLIAFGQTSPVNTVTAIANLSDTGTTLSVTDAATDVTQLFGVVGSTPAFFDLTAASTGPAGALLGLVAQHFNGSFCITSLAGCGGVDYLSGTFTDAAVGAAGGPGLTVNVNNPPDLLALSSSVIPAADLAAPNTLDLGFSNLIPDLALCGATLCSFTASFAGDASANLAVPEPTSLALLGLGVLGVLGVLCVPGTRRRHA